MRIFYCFENEIDKYVTEIVDAWIDSNDQDKNKAKFCFQDFTNLIYVSDTVQYEHALMWLRCLEENGYVNLEYYIFKLEKDNE